MAFVPQNACIYNMSVRDNILFGKPLHYGKYMQIMTACGLLDDMDHLAAGDLTEVGEKSTMDLYLSAIRMENPWFLLASVSFIIRAAAVGAYLLWVKQWANSNDSSRDWVTGIAGLCASDVFFGCLGALFLAIGFLQMSSRIHHGMTWGVLSSPVRFFDATPRGRILNRFSTDLDGIDTRLFIATKQVMQTLPAAAAKITVTGLQSILAGLLGSLAAGIFIVIVAYLAKACNAARRLESVEYSRLLQHVTETRDSLAVVRSYRVQEYFSRHCCRLVDASIRGLAAYVDVMRTVRFSGGICGLVITMTTVAFVMFGAGSNGSGGYDGASVGLALTSSMGIAILFTAALVGMFNFIQMAVSFERCLEYTRLPPEDDAYRGQDQEVEMKKASENACSTVIPYTPAALHENWPSKGTLQFDGYTASYRPGVLPDVLVGVSFEVDSCEKASEYQCRMY
ncbi:hypothetical protein HPB50_000297 [Hyalomma asiaticum]|uniref:Uncharacterized protein n=1 Tax=Hyalomma asiaticum TaxID=266040 RepID=A0ACB7RRD8_HYAAI|nr:hypothetical protein HPB50_000297 [Hyalomma asiaticum]